MYSPPEPPRPPERARAPRRLAVALAAVVALVLAAGGGYLLFPDPGQESAAPAASSAQEREASVGGGDDEPRAERTIGALPPPCSTVESSTVRSLVPDATREQGANQTLSTCTFASPGDPAHWLRVEVRLYPSGTQRPVQDADSHFDSAWTKANNEVLARTVSLARDDDMGDEAYRWFREDESGAAVLGQVTVRVRNAVITVGYSEATPRGAGAGAAEAREDECLRNATRVAREVLGRFR
jgi:hypothetical protein